MDGHAAISMPWGGIIKMFCESATTINCHTNDNLVMLLAGGTA